MFIGHFAVGFATKAAAPRASLGTHFAAVEFLDIVWPPLVLLGIEQVKVAPGITAFTPLDFIHYPWSHSLVMAALWSLLFGGVHYWRKRDASTALWLGGAVFSHWVLDWISHRPDMPIAPGMDAKLGLGLWNSIPATVAVEVVAFLGTAWWYTRKAPTRDRLGTWALIGLVLLMLLIYVGNIGTIPPNATLVAASGVGLWLFVLIAWWADRHRSSIA